MENAESKEFNKKRLFPCVILSVYKLLFKD